VFTSHPVVSVRMRELLPKVAPDVGLETSDPWAGHLADYGLYREIASGWARQPLRLAASRGQAPGIAPLRLAALVRLFYTVPGECDQQKLEALTAVFPLLPRGDIVEIGSLWGRSAAALAFLSRNFETGKLLCVDPWEAEELWQGIVEVDSSFGRIPIEEVFDAFRMNLAPFAGLVNYARMRSVDAASIYGTPCCFATEDFGRTTYTGRIALLHIDGNHALDAVRSDISLWGKWVRRGGWIVFDDYCWSFGGGPRIAANEFCREFDGSLAGGFVAGGALFLRVARRLSRGPLPLQQGQHGLG